MNAEVINKLANCAQPEENILLNTCRMEEWLSLSLNRLQRMARNYVLKQNIIGENIECVYYCLNENELEEKKIIKTFGKEKNKLVITSLGIIVINFLIKYYDDIFNYEYTKDMEYFLDEIEKGLKQKEDICLLCYKILIR